MDKKLTDKEIVNALENVAEWFTEHGKNTNTAVIGISKQAIDLINRLQAKNKRLGKEVNLVSIQFQDLQERYEEAQTENENLKVENQSLRSAANSLKMYYEETQAEVEKLKNRFMDMERSCHNGRTNGVS